MGFLLTYQDLILLPTFEQRFNYLKVNGRCSEKTRKQVDEIFGTLSKKDKNMLNADGGSEEDG